MKKQNKDALTRAEAAIAAGKKDLEKEIETKPEEKKKKRLKVEPKGKKDWPICPECGIRPMAPWNKSGRCSHCQQYRKK